MEQPVTLGQPRADGARSPTRLPAAAPAHTIEACRR
jgi:hypothetical protein